VVLGFALKSASNFYYDSQPGFAGVREFFRPFSDLADSDRQKIENKKIAFSDNDYALVKYFFVADRSIFTTTALSNAVNASSLPFTFNKLLWVLTTNIGPVMLVVLLSYWLVDPKYLSLPRMLLWLAGLISLILYLAFFMKLPTRVHLTLLTCTMTTLFTFMDRRKLKQIASKFTQADKSKRAKSIAVISVLSVALLLSTLWVLNHDYQIESEENREIKTAIKNLKPTPDQLYIVLGTTTPYQFIRPFENLRTFFSGFDIYRTSLWSRMPAGDGMLKKHGFRDLKEACNSPAVLFISNENANARFARFCREHYQMEVKFNRIFENQTLDLNVYKLELVVP